MECPQRPANSIRLLPLTYSALLKPAGSDGSEPSAVSTERTFITPLELLSV